MPPNGEEEMELDYVDPHNVSVDSEEPLSEVAHRLRFSRNGPESGNFRWHSEENVPRRFGFGRRPGVKEDLGLSATSEPKEVLDTIFTPELWQRMVEETNRYAAQHPPPASPHMKEWTDTSVEELGRLVGLRLLMGIVRLPETKMYWSQDPLLGQTAFKNAMTRDRFEQLSSKLHFNDNEDPDAATDRLHKLRPVIDVLAERCKDVFTPEQKISVDESLLAYRGRHHAVQFNPTKRARFGLKLYRLCAADGPAAGYTSSFKVYLGQERSEIPASMRAVTDLMHSAGAFDGGHELYMDNWFSSPQLFHYLQSRRTNAVGTVRKNRKFMPEDLSVSRRGEVSYRSTATGLLALSWMDKKQVNMLSTVHTSQMEQLPPNWRGIVREKPKVVIDYNNGKKGVDVADQLARSYPAPRKARKWYVKLWYHLLDMMVVNAHAIHKWLGGRMTQLQFRHRLVSQLLFKEPERRAGRPAPSLAPRASSPHGTTLVPSAFSSPAHSDNVSF